MNVLLLPAVGMISLCSAFSVTERSCRHFSVRLPSAGLESIRQHQQPQCLDHRRRQPTELCSSSSISSKSSNDEDLLPGISVIDEANGIISEQMENLQDSPYFRLFCVDILASCEYMPQELFECYTETCEVYPVDDDDVSFESFENLLFWKTSPMEVIPVLAIDRWMIRER
jgi:hypothetical protein